MIMLSEFQLKFFQIHRGMFLTVTVYDYSCVNWDALHDHVRDAPWKDILKLETSTATSKFYE